jgi:hypothetical protein
MNRKNKKGFGLVMAIMIITVLFIMAAGFFQVTDYSTKSVARNERNFRLYWAAESASNYNVNYWVNLDSDTRIVWPSTYTPTEGAKAMTYNDINGYKVEETKFPNGAGTTHDGVYYLHASSLLELPNNPDIDGYKVITTRYKGSRKDKPDEAVWVLESYAWDPENQELMNITMTNVYNAIYIQELAWLQNSESIVRSMYATGFNGALGAFHEKDIRYGPCYYADLMRFDLQTSGSTGARFFGGPVKNSLVQSNPTFPYHRSRYGNAQIENMTGLFNIDNEYGYGVSIKANYANQDLASAEFRTMLNNGLTPYFKDEAPLPTENVTWTWQDVKDEGPGMGVYFLPENASGNVTVTLIYDSGTNSTKAKLSGGHTAEIVLGKGSGTYTGVAVPKNYGQVNISGSSNRDFTLITETNQVNIVGSFYVAEMKPTLDWLQTQPIDQNLTPEYVLKQAWQNMGNSNSKAKLSIISQLNKDETPVGDAFTISPPRAGLVFTTVAMLTHDGFLNTPLRTRSDLRYVNIGSVITLNHQGADGGDASGAWTKALIQDQRYLDPSFGIPEFWGAGPSIMEQYPVSGLNRQHRWTRENIIKTSSWEKIVWPNGQTPSF